jgi:hypothetical protein
MYFSDIMHSAPKNSEALAQDRSLWNRKCVSNKCEKKWVNGDMFEQTSEVKDGLFKTSETSTSKNTRK